MKTVVIGFALLHACSLSYAAPASAQLEAREVSGRAVAEPRQLFEAPIYFYGAGNDPPYYYQGFLTDDSVHPISKFSISQTSAL